MRPCGSKVVSRSPAALPSLVLDGSCEPVLLAASLLWSFLLILSSELGVASLERVGEREVSVGAGA